MQALDNRSATFLLYAGIAGTAHEIVGNVILWRPEREPVQSHTENDGK